MVDPIENLPFDAFDKAHAPMWSAAVLSFDKDKERVEQLTKAFIDSSFKKLRSAEGKVLRQVLLHAYNVYVKTFTTFDIGYRVIMDRIGVCKPNTCHKL